jgi:hypothetical protein
MCCAALQVDEEAELRWALDPRPLTALRRLREMAGQGYLVSAPLMGSVLTAWLACCFKWAWCNNKPAVAEATPHCLFLHVFFTEL